MAAPMAAPARPAIASTPARPITPQASRPAPASLASHGAQAAGGDGLGTVLSSLAAAGSIAALFKLLTM